MIAKILKETLRNSEWKEGMIALNAFIVNDVAMMNKMDKRVLNFRKLSQ